MVWLLYMLIVSPESGGYLFPQENFLLSPAQLGYFKEHQLSGTVLNFSGEFANNAFNFTQYNRYSGAYLEEGDKEHLLSSIPPKGLELTTRSEVNLLRLKYGKWGLSLQSEGEGQARVPRDFFELVLKGNEIGREYELGGMRAHAWVLTRFSLGTGYRIGNFGLGVMVHYLQGMFYSRLINRGANLITTPEVVIGEGCMGYLQANNGQGWAGSLGISYFTSGMVIGLSLLDVNTGMLWCDGKHATYTVKLDSINLYDLITNQDKIRYHSELDEGVTFVTHMPTKVRGELLTNVLDRLDIGFATLGKILKEDGVTLLGWELEGVGQFRIKEWLPINFGVTVNNYGHVRTSAGLGINWKNWYVNLEIGQIDGLLLGAKGVGFNWGLTYRAGRCSQQSGHRSIYRISAEPSP